MILKCKKCKRRWNYSGEKEYYTTCPDCKTSVKIKTRKNGVKNVLMIKEKLL